MGVRFDLTDPDFIRDPYATYAALRAEPGISSHPSPLGDALYPVSRHEDVVEVLRRPDVFSSSAMILPGTDGPDTSLIGLDPPVHTEQRNIVNRGFTPRRVKSLEARIRALVDELFEAFETQGEVELIEALAAPLPVMVIAELVGLDPGQHRQLKAWSDNLVVGASSGAERTSGFEAGLQEFREFLLEMIEQRRKSPGDDLISVLIHAEQEAGVLNANQVQNFVQLLVAAGSETTTNLLGTAVYMMTQRPDACAELRGDPTWVPAWIEESLRFDSPVQLVMRRLTADAEISRTTLPKEGHVFALLGSANRDETQFADADRFDFHRKASGLLAFGLGTHFCLGASLARLEAKLALEAVVARLPKLELAADEVERQGSFLVRGPARLPLVFEA